MAEEQDLVDALNMAFYSKTPYAPYGAAIERLHRAQLSGDPVQIANAKVVISEFKRRRGGASSSTGS